MKKETSILPTTDDSCWEKLCLHAILRSIVIGNLTMQALFVRKQAAFFEGVETQETVERYIRDAHTQTVVFGIVGLFTRSLLLWKPFMDKHLSYLGIALWITGIFVFTMISSSITYPVSFTLSVTLLSGGGGLYYWASTDDIILLTKYLTNPHLFMIIFGGLTTAYVVGTHWIYIDLSSTNIGYSFVNPIIFLMSFPIIISLCTEEWLHKDPIEMVTQRESSPNYAEEWANIVPNQQNIEEGEKPNSPRSYSFEIHVTFLFFFAIFRQLPPITLFLNIQYTLEQNEVLLFWKSLGTMFGNMFFAAFYRWMYIPSVCAMILPICIADWLINQDNFTLIERNIFVYGFCVGILEVWTVKRVIDQWLIRFSWYRLTILLWIVSVVSLPGDLFTSIWIELFNAISRSVADKYILLSPSMLISCICLLLILMHWIVFYLYEDGPKEDESSWTSRLKKIMC